MRFCSSSLTVVSSSLDDCSSSFEVSSSSLVLCSSSFDDCSSSFDDFSSSLALSSSSIVLCRYSLVTISSRSSSSRRSSSGEPLAGASPRPRAGDRACGLRLVEQDEEAARSSSRARRRAPPRCSSARVFAVLGQPRARPRRARSPPAPRGARGAARRAARARQAQDVEAGRARHRLEVRPGAAPEVDDVEVLVDDHAGRPVELEDLPLAPALARLLADRCGDAGLNRRRRVGACTPKPKSSAGGRGDVRFAVDLVLAVDERNSIRGVAHGLRGAEQQEAGRLQRVVQDAQHPLLHRRLQVDEQVAAAHQVEPRERRVLGDVLVREHHHVADAPRDLVLRPPS